MSGKYWIKLYHEILEDPKMIRMDDRLFRRTIQLFLLAGREEMDGFLPPIEDISVCLRCEEEELETELIELQRLGIVGNIDGMWLVTKFTDRQAAMPKAEYMRRKRATEKSEEYYQEHYQPVTESVTNSNTDKIRIDKEQETEEEQKRTETTAAVFQSFQNEIQMLSPHNSQMIDDWLEEYPHDWILDAIREAVANNVRKPKYIAAILANWKANGRGSGKKRKGDHEPRQYISGQFSEYIEH